MLEPSTTTRSKPPSHPSWRLSSYKLKLPLEQSIINQLELLFKLSTCLEWSLLGLSQDSHHTSLHRIKAKSQLNNMVCLIKSWQSPISTSSNLYIWASTSATYALSSFHHSRAFFHSFWILFHPLVPNQLLANLETIKSIIHSNNQSFKQDLLSNLSNINYNGNFVNKWAKVQHMWNHGF